MLPVGADWTGAGGVGGAEVGLASPSCQTMLANVGYLKSRHYFCIEVRNAAMSVVVGLDSKGDRVRRSFVTRKVVRPVPKSGRRAVAQSIGAAHAIQQYI